MMFGINHKIMSVIQGAVTTEEPFQITNDGIFYRDEKWGLQFLGKYYHIKMTNDIKDVLNDAYKRGFSDGVQTGLKMMHGINNNKI